MRYGYRRLYDSLRREGRKRAAVLAERGELVVRLDEKPNIQALGRPIPELPPQSHLLGCSW